jgi:DNA-binding transcriptional MerR regulator
MEQLEPSAKLDQLFAEKQDKAGRSYRIGDLAREFGVTLRTLRFYEDRGLINPQREGSTRLYFESDRARLKLILLAKQVGFSLVEIQGIMSIYDNGSRFDDPLKLVVDKFERQMDVLIDERQEIDAAIAKLATTIDKLNEISAEES